MICTLSVLLVWSFIALKNANLEGCKLEKFSFELNILVKEQHEKANFVDLCNAYPEAFPTFYSYSLRKNH